MVQLGWLCVPCTADGSRAPCEGAHSPCGAGGTLLCSREVRHATAGEGLGEFPPFWISDSAFCEELPACQSIPIQWGTSRQPLPWSLAHSAWHRPWMLQSRSTGLQAISRSNRKTGRPTILSTFKTRRSLHRNFSETRFSTWAFSCESYSLSIGISIPYPDTST